MVAAGALIAAGARVRAAHRPEPPNPAEEPEWVQPEPRARPRGPDRRAERSRPRSPRRSATGPRWEGEAPEPPGGARKADPPDDSADPTGPTDRLF